MMQAHFHEHPGLHFEYAFPKRNSTRPSTTSTLYGVLNSSKGTRLYFLLCLPWNGYSFPPFSENKTGECFMPEKLLTNCQLHNFFQFPFTDMSNHLSSQAQGKAALEHKIFCSSLHWSHQPTFLLFHCESIHPLSIALSRADGDTTLPYIFHITKN